MRNLFFDIETCSVLDLRKVGSNIYARHASTDIRCASYCLVVDDVRGPIETWIPPQPAPQTILDIADDPSIPVWAFNNAFDRQIWEHILGPRYGWPVIALARQRCAQAAALARALPASLDAAAAALKIPIRKSADGIAMMRRLAKPRRQSAKERKAGKPLDFSITPKELEALVDYNRRDVSQMMEIVDRVGQLPPDEQMIWILDQQINARGVHVDVALLEAGLCLGQAAKRELCSELAELTKDVITAPGQTKRMLVWLAERGCVLGGLRKNIVADALLETGLDPAARRLLELRQNGAGTAALKFATLRRWVSDDDPEPRIRFAYRYHGASSGRFTSTGVQLHNLRKPELANVPEAIAAVATGSLVEMRRRGFAKPFDTIGQVARAAITAAPGKRLLIGDLSGIESRGAAFICNAVGKLEQWRAFDRTGKPEDEPYYITGVSTFQQPSEQARKAGKVGELAFQYQGGVGAYRRITGDVLGSDEEIAQRRDAWRNAHPQYVEFWRLTVFQAVQALRNPGMEFPAKAIAFAYDRRTGFLEVTLPSGRKLTYPRAELIEDEQYGTVSFTFLDASGSSTGRMYHEKHNNGVFGGLLLENVTQALCRDIFTEAMPRLEAAGYSIVMHTHDEWAVEVPEDFGSLEEFLALITAPPSWAPDLPIAAKVRIAGRLIEISEPKQAAAIVIDNALENKILSPDDELEESEEPEELEEGSTEPAESGEPEESGELEEPVTSPAPEPHSCVQCGAAPDGSECSSAYEGVWLHPRCIEAFTRARMAEQGSAWVDYPASPPPDPLPPPEFNKTDGRSNNGSGGNGSDGDEDDGLEGFDLAAFLRPTRGNGAQNGNGAVPDRDDYARGENRSSGPATAQYIYKNALGRLHMRVDRTAGKRFPTYHWSDGEWAAGWPEKVVPYRLPELLAAAADELVVITEGEKDADTAARYGFISTCNPGGAGKWQPELTQYFQGKKRVCIMEDNDAAAAKHTALILNALHGVVPTIGVVRFPELKIGGDLTDFFEAGGSKPYLLTRIEEALKEGIARPYVIVRASEVELENVSWLWPNHLAHGALELLTGDPDLGKSQIHMSYAACVTRGTPWPDGFPGSQPQQVLLVTAEDNYANTVGPRAVAAGVDLTALIYFKGLVRNGKHEIFLLSSGLRELEQVLLDHDNVGLVLIDPITAYMGSPTSGRFDSHRATDVRSVLGPLKDLAERRRTAISAITHPPKGAKASPLDSFIGSQAYVAAARIAHLCVPETEAGLAGAVRNTGRVFFTQVKNNIGLKASTLAYHLDTKSIGFDRCGEPLKPAPYVLWEDAVDITSAEALAQTRAVAKTKVNPVHEFLRDILASGPVLQKIIVERGAAKKISLSQLRRARKAIGAVTFKRRGGNVISPWLWALPEHVPDDVEREDESAPEGDA
jgi:DNA polymerase bacteriophage-type